MNNILVKYKYLFAFAIFLIHLIFKSYGIAFISFWFDEAYSVYWSGHDISEIIEESLKNDPNPPLYISLLHYWVMIFGDDAYGIRLFSVTASSLAGSALFLFCIRFFNWQTAVFASMMYFTSNELYFYGIEARTFSVLILFSILTYHVFLSLVEVPKIWKALLLGILNASVIYFHLLAGFIIVGEIILFPVLALHIIYPLNDIEKKNLRFSVSKKTLILFCLSLLATFSFLYPWIERLLQYSQNGIKNFWLAKPTYRVFKDCIYDFFNSKDLFNIYTYAILLTLLLVLTVKKLRQQPISKKLILFAFIVGPGLIFINYFMAGYIPIFLKRYVLFTSIGFILLYAYIFSLLKLNFYIKFLVFGVLSFFSLQKITYPRESTFEYDKAIVFLKKVQSKNTFITNDCQDLFSYYYDKRSFYIKAYHLKHEYLKAHGIYTPFNTDWPETENLTGYKMIYHTNTFESIGDPGHIIENKLKSKFKLITTINYFKGIEIQCYYNPAYKEPFSK
ncbi:MAG TPA: glycosyltransferase family 39 protein [Bacteroidia bacterium]|jgi:uncharacterized membrane protein|nr:glycosyltransferase family 39 protein [Bacteroidia bacterium]